MPAASACRLALPRVVATGQRVFCRDSFCVRRCANDALRVMERKKKKTDTHCYAPGCMSGYPGFREANGRTLSLFGVPKDNERRKQWDRNLHRKDKTLSETSAVCERHFEEHFILRDYVHVVNGQEVKIPRGKPALTDDAVPTLLPDLPAYLSKETRQRRPERKRVAACPAICTKKLRLSRRDVLDTSSPDVGADGDDSLDGMVPRHGLHTIVHTVSVRNEWARLEAPDFDGVVFATTSVKKEPFALLHERVLMFATDCAYTVTARLYCRGKERKDVAIRSVKEAAETFRYSDSALLCKGAMDQAEFDNNYSKDTTCHLKHSVDIAYGIVLSRSCSGTVSKEGKHFTCSATLCC